HFTGLTVDYMRAHGVKVAIKGLRVISDFEYELQMALMNKSLAEDVETFFMMTRSEHLFLSSSMVKELAGFDTPLDALVPPCVVEPLKAKINSKR
ncbi:MAG: pantetheine-phosphate adenylyltransferase, partial [Abditibacteriota bacterium]|nr:pantetheine-phosphate adenylyltransferase [Abditibacteriota bacterium]